MHLLDILPDELFSALSTITMKLGSADEFNEAQNALYRDRDISVLIGRFRAPLEKMAKGNSGAQRHVRLRAKETLARISEKEEEEGLETLQRQWS